MTIFRHVGAYNYVPGAQEVKGGHWVPCNWIFGWFQFQHLPGVGAETQTRIL